jgi:hypothetical protein
MGGVLGYATMKGTGKTLRTAIVTATITRTGQIRTSYFFYYKNVY